jgi:hypothetical protein
MNRKLVGLALFGLGVALIVLGISLRVPSNCPSPYNGTGPPPPTAPCFSAVTWTPTSFGTFGSGIVFTLLGAAVALSGYSKESVRIRSSP